MRVDYGYVITTHFCRMKSIIHAIMLTVVQLKLDKLERPFWEYPPQ